MGACSLIVNIYITDNKDLKIENFHVFLSGEIGQSPFPFDTSSGAYAMEDTQRTGSHARFADDICPLSSRHASQTIQHASRAT